MVEDCDRVADLLETLEREFVPIVFEACELHFVARHERREDPCVCDARVALGDVTYEGPDKNIITASTQKADSYHNSFMYDNQLEEIVVNGRLIRLSGKMKNYVYGSK
mmetsp:Transcript_10946/g.24094  ORF Transcript_10946/g.24094 Transcript_10946/m.24094 type:complete len:108 (-) Transcript_10946:445-768(-)